MKASTAAAIAVPPVPPVPPSSTATVAPEHFERVVRALGRDGKALQGEPLVSWSLSAPIERTSTTLCRAELRSSSRTAHVFIKIFRDGAETALSARSACEQARAEFDELERVSRAFVGAEHTGITQPVALIAEERAVVTLAARGDPLAAIVDAAAKRGWRRARNVDMRAIGGRIADWLHRFQAMSPPHPLALDELRAYVSARVARFPDGWTPRFGDRILERFDVLASALSSDDRLAVDLHADFTMENILVDGARVTVLDFVGGRRGMRLNDVAHLIMQLDVAARKPWLDASVVRTLQDAIIRGFDPSLTRESPAFQLAYLCNAVPRILHRAELGGDWLTRSYSAYLWRPIERSVLLGTAP